MKKTSVLFVALLALRAAAAAQDAAEPARPHGACKADAKTLCPDMKPGQGVIVNCLMGKAEQIQNADCKAFIGVVKTRRDSIRQACSAEIAKCPGTDFGTGLLKCLNKSRKDMSEGCKAALKEARAERKAAKAKERAAATQPAAATPAK
jgi:hypothetical protein